MPSSHSNQLNEIVRLICLTDPKSLLDIGIGFGKYGFLAREYLELWDGREKYDDWKRRVDGIEVFPQYVTPMHKIIYNNVFIGNALDILPGLKENYDLVLLIDVLEHFDFQDGIRLLEECKRRCRNIIVSTPLRMTAQKDAFDNPFETHRFQWQRKHFGRFANKFFVAHELSLICYIGDDAQTVRRKQPSEIKSLIKKYFLS